MSDLDPLRNMGKPWSNDDIQTLRRLYPDTPGQTLARIFGRDRISIRNAARRHSLRKTADFMASGPGQFRPGNRSWNQGMKGLDTGGHAGHFKPGQRPASWNPVGHERVSQCDILERKVTDTGVTRRDYRSVHSLVWEEHNGPIPAGHIVVFRDGDRRHFDIDNLELISRAENMRRNSIHQLPPELAELCRWRGVLTRKLNQRSQA